MTTEKLSSDLEVRSAQVFSLSKEIWEDFNLGTLGWLREFGTHSVVPLGEDNDEDFVSSPGMTVRLGDGEGAVYFEDPANISLAKDQGFFAPWNVIAVNVLYDETSLELNQVRYDVVKAINKSVLEKVSQLRQSANGMGSQSCFYFGTHDDGIIYTDYVAEDNWYWHFEVRIRMAMAASFALS